MECNVYHLMLVVGVWLAKKWRFFEKLSGLYRSATKVGIEVVKDRDQNFHGLKEGGGLH